MLELVAYIALCTFTGFFGINRRIGFFATFLLAIIATPFIVLPVLLLTSPSRRIQ